MRDHRVDVIADSSGAAATALAELASPTNAAKLKKSERDQLKGIIRDLWILQHGQLGMIQRMRRVTDERDAGGWAAVRMAIPRVAGKVAELMEFLSHFEGDIIYKDLDTYRQLQSMTMSRAGIYAELENMSPPETEEGWDLLAAVVDQIENLLAQIPAVREHLSDYPASE